MSELKKGVYRVLKRFFNYIKYSILPNVNVHFIEDDKDNNIDVNSFITEESIKERIWGCKTKSKYYALIQLVNLKYVYLYGNNDFYTDNFTVYVSSNIDDVLSYMPRAIYNKYTTDT